MTRALIALCFVTLLAGCSSNYSWGWYEVLPTTQSGINNLKFLAKGYGYTISLSVVAFSCALILGFLMALPAFAKNRTLRWTNRSLVEFFRSVPVLVMLLWVHYGLPVILGLNFSVFTSGVVGLALCEAAFIAEIFRGGIQSIARGQHEAADSLALSPADKMRFVILPQALRRMLPPLGNQFVYMLKMSALVSVIGLNELTRQANDLVTNLYRPLEIYTVLILEYLVLILVVSWAVRRLELRYGSNEAAN